MVLSVDHYLEIRNILLHIGCSARSLRDLKLNFASEINSQRTFERTHSLSYLFKILEKRDAIGPNHVDKLVTIINEVSPNNMEIKNILYDCQPRNINDENIIYNRVLTNNDRMQEMRVLPPVPPDTVQRINEMVKINIGHKWKELGRALNVPEGQLDNLETHYRFTDVPRMVHEILRFHQEKCATNYELWRKELQQALVKARRQDLSDDIDDILIHHPIHT